jgi:signal transduction histidine kinase
MRGDSAAVILSAAKAPGHFARIEVRRFAQDDSRDDTRTIEPLFAHNVRLWLRVWAAVQTVALLVGCYTVLRDAGGFSAFFASPSAVAASVAIALLIAYHAVGFRAHTWILARPWAPIVYVPLGWLLILWSLRFAPGFVLLVFGAVLQGFIFLPFAAAITTLVLVIALLAGIITMQSRGVWNTLAIARLLSVVAMGVMIGTVMLYIHRVNRDAAIRARLLRQLDDAQRDLADRARESGVQEERQRLARDIHDTLAQGFTSVIKHLEAIELSFAATDASAESNARDAMTRAVPHLAHARDVSRASLGEIRRLVWALRPPQLAEATLGAALERIVAQWSEANAVTATCEIANMPPLQPEADVIFLRATQEALSNVAKHAHATSVSVGLHAVDGLALLSIDDDGRGFVEADVDGEGKFGIAGMRERVRRFGGHVLIESTPGEGTSVTVAMPLTAITGHA